MKRKFLLLGGFLAAGLIAGTAISQDNSSQDDIDPAFARAIDARQAHMQLSAFNLSLLGGMAKGEIEYDADAAKAAAGNLVALARMDESRYWLEGTDMEALGLEHTEALASIWSETSEMKARAQTMIETSEAMLEASGNGLGALRGAMAPLGQSCGGCHEDYRVADD